MRSIVFFLGVLAGLAVAWGEDPMPGIPVKGYESVASGPAKAEKSIITETSGQVIIDGSLRTAAQMGTDKWIELIWTSTPSTPSAGRAKIWLNQQGSTSTALKVMFDDGVARTLSAN